MMNIPWRLKSTIFGLIDFLNAPNVLYFLQKYVTCFRHDMDLKQRPDQYRARCEGTKKSKDKKKNGLLIIGPRNLDFCTFWIVDKMVNTNAIRAAI